MEPRICDYEWASVARYITGLSGRLCLKEFNWDEARSMRVTSSPEDLAKLLVRKRRIRDELGKNLEAIASYVEANKSELGEAEMVAIRGLYSTQLDAQRDVIVRINTIKSLMRVLQGPLPGDDQLPF